jgi:U4/U6 small nuclear ribonucleoprotein SNU13
MEITERARPLAESELTNSLLKLCEKAVKINKLKRGANETTKALNRDVSELIILAADAVPLEIILHLPLLCEDKSVPYIFVPSMEKLGIACGASRNVIACAIVKNDRDNSLDEEIKNLQNLVEKCYYSNF